MKFPQWTDTQTGRMALQTSPPPSQGSSAVFARKALTSPEMTGTSDPKTHAIDCAIISRCQEKAHGKEEVE